MILQGNNRIVNNAERFIGYPVVVREKFLTK